MKLLSLFSGIGAFEKALENLGIPYELINYCELDKYASKAYSIIHKVSEDKNLCDVTKIDTSKLPKDIDLITYGFPCQDISIAGKQAGLEGTRSGLVWEAHRVIEDLKPKVAICENVKNLTSKKFAKEFKAILGNLEDIGYNNYWQVLDAKDYGIPQHRERVFIISIRKDIDKGFTFPAKIPLKSCVLDILDAEVDERYFLSQKLYDYFMRRNEECIEKKLGFRFKPLDLNRVVHTIVTKAGQYPTDNYIDIIELGNLIQESNFKNPQRGRIYSPNGTSPTLIIQSSGGLPLKFLLKSHIRRLTPKECFRLMGFCGEDVPQGISDTQLYKLAGNSIVVNVLMEIFKNLRRYL